MRFGKTILAIGVLAAGAFTIRGELEIWVQHVPAGPAIAALFRGVSMPGGAVPILLPPSETRPALAKLIANTPRDAALYRLRAQEDEIALDFTAAEADWKLYVQTAPDPYAAQIELADFFHRRMRTRDEIAALMAASGAKDDPLLPATSQRGWAAFERMAALGAGEDLPTSVAEPVFRAWVARYPKQREAWRKLIDYLSAHKQYAAAETSIADYARAFHDDLEPVRMRADLELRRGSPAAALEIYDRAFQPSWPQEMTAAYFKLLEEHGQLRQFAGRARTALEANPADLDAAARLFHYFKSQNNPAAARRVLLEYRMAKESGASHWTADELETAAQLFARLPDVNETARMYYALYSVQPATPAHAERALYGLADLLLTAPDQPIQFGSGDLSFYKDIATADPSPGFLNGILSLLLNSTQPRREYRNANQKSLAYFHRAAASRLVDLLEQRFPQSGYREVLRAQLISAYAGYGDDASVIQAGRAYLAAFPNGAGSVAVAMEVADALARADRTDEEFALYDQLLRELAGKALNVPLGVNNSARSPEYAQVLDRYLSRLAELNRPLDALRVYRREMDRNPNDPGLYERLAVFLEQHHMAGGVEQIYTQAIAKFGTRSWYDKLARWYLREKQYAEMEKISRQAITVFSGTELERYFNETVSRVHPDAVLHRQLNLYAHERFPEDLVFVNNLLNAYGRLGTYDPAAADRLVRQYWFYDAQLRSRFFAGLSLEGRLYPELAQVRAANPGIVDGHLDRALAANPAAVQFAAEAEIWLSHFEAAAPAARALADAYPGKREFADQASALYRSLAAYDPRDTGIALQMADYEHRADPHDGHILARMGDILADRDLFSQARAYWDRMPAAEPGNAAAYLDTATIYWDYYLYNDALRWIEAARKRFHDPALYAFEAGAIYENKHNDAGAIREYIAGALHADMASQNLLLRLGNRPRTSALVDRETAAAVASDPSIAAVKLRVAVLEAGQRRHELEVLLQSRVAVDKSAAALTELQETGRRLGFTAIEERASERLIAITNDPVDKMRLTFGYARLLESKKDITQAASTVDALYHAHPLILGVVRGAVDFHLRNQQPDEAITILLDAAKRARTDLAAQFTLESARIATRAGEFDRARTLLAPLLGADPLRAEYLAAMADTYLAAKDDAGFRDFELATIQRFKQSPLAPAERIARITEIRRSLIPALDRLKDYAGAVDQYIECIDNYPDDESLTKEAASYAVAHGLTDRMLAFYRKTVADAPRDYRWPIVLARIETVAEDYPAAIADYERAIKDRPDRADLFESKGQLEERLMRFDDAIRTYNRLHELAYRDPQWMIKVAELQARRGQNAEAVAALKTAIIGAHTETADADFDIAQRLETWRMIPQAVTFAEAGERRIGSDFNRADYHTAIYVRIMARARRIDAVLSHLISPAGTVPQGSAEVGQIVSELYTPEQKLRFEQAMIAQATHLLPLAQSAGLAALEARWRLEDMSGQHERIDQRLVQLQSQRGLYGELGNELEAYAARNVGQPVEPAALAQAAQAYIAAGDIESQMRVMRTALVRNMLGGALLDRYLALLVNRDPAELLALARGSNRAVQFAIADGPRELAYQAVDARGSGLPPVWSKALTALTGEYFNDHSAAIQTAFEQALDTRTIGERIAAPLKPDQVISGSIWFYYGERYGDYLSIAKNPAAEWWLPASLEAAPGNPLVYIALGDLYAQRGQASEAVTQYEHALALDRDRGDAHDHIARVLWSEGRRTEAITQWKSALAAFTRIQDRGVRVPGAYWGWVAETFNDIGERRGFVDLRGATDNLLEDYYRRNRLYRFEELVEPAFHAALASGDGIAWLVNLSTSLDVSPANWTTPRDLTDAQRIALQRADISFDSKRVAASFGDERAQFENQLTAARLTLISLLLDAGDLSGAQSEWKQIPPQSGAEVEIRMAAKTGGLAALLTRYRTQPEFAPPMETLRNAAMRLDGAGDKQAAQSVLEFMYEREIRNGNLTSANFLGLAEVKLVRNETAAAIHLLDRMTLVTENGFDTLLPAADLLSKYGNTHAAEDFIRRRIKAVPWDADARMHLAKIVGAGSPAGRQLLAAVMSDSQAPYILRAEAARLAAPQRIGEPGTELALLSSGAVSPDAAEKPFYVEARMAASLWMQALAIAPEDDRVRLGAIRAALTQHRDNLALALAQVAAPAEPVGFVLPRMPLSNDQRANLAESLAAAAERLDDLSRAAQYLRTAIGLRPVDQRAALQKRLDAIVAEQGRRAKNAARRPVIRDTIEQDQIVRARIVGGAQ